MNVALVVLPNNAVPIAPPLTLAYVAAVLEQQRNIVRIYDLALSSDIPLETALRPLRTFRPQVVVIAGSDLSLLKDVAELLHEHHEVVLPLHVDRNDLDVEHVCASMMAWLHKQNSVPNDNSVIHANDAQPHRFIDNLDQLPVPARHLLSLERYSLRAVGNKLQTTLLVGMPDRNNNDVIFRSPAQIIAELRGVSREYGIRHYLFPGVDLTADIVWLREFLLRAQEASLNIGWEASVSADSLDEALLTQMAQAGCEALSFNFNTAQVFESTKTRTRVKQIVACARHLGIYARADLDLDPPYESIPHLVDVAATFGLDDVGFRVYSSQVQDKAVSMQGEASTQIEEFARRRYHAGRNRQQMIDRFGKALGTLLWRLRNSRIGLVLESERVAAGLEEREAESA